MTTEPRFRPLTGLYEPSAILQLPDGRFLVVEDEKEHPFCLLTLGADGDVSSDPLTPGLFESADGFWKLDDLEGLTLDRSGHVFAITSQSLSGKGEAKKSREKLVRFRIDGNRVVEAATSTKLKRALTEAHQVLATAADIADVKSDGGLNIEALEICPDDDSLWIGFRSPLLDQCALLARLENPADLFDDEGAARIAPSLVRLDLGGHGMRGMSYLPGLNGYLVISGPVGRERSPFRLWFWNGQPESRARRVTVAGLDGFGNAEGICPALIDGQQRIVIVSDDGHREEGRCARVLILDPQHLQIEP